MNHGAGGFVFRSAMVAELAEANLKQIIEMYLDDDTECSEENEIIFISVEKTPTSASGE